MRSQGMPRRSVSRASSRSTPNSHPSISKRRTFAQPSPRRRVRRPTTASIPSPVRAPKELDDCSASAAGPTAAATARSTMPSRSEGTHRTGAPKPPRNGPSLSRLSG